MCPLCATSITTNGFHAYASVSHSLQPIAISHRDRTTIVSMSQTTNASFIANVESWMPTTSRKKSCAAGGYGVRARTAWHPLRFARVRGGHRRIGGHDRVRVVATLLHAAIPEVPHHVAVGSDRRQGEWKPE